LANWPSALLPLHCPLPRCFPSPHWTQHQTLPGLARPCSQAFLFPCPPR
jgi:hypothetical protein